MGVPSLREEQNGPHSLTYMDTHEPGYGTVSAEENRDLSNEFYGVQKVVLMKRLGKKWDKILVITG